MFDVSGFDGNLWWLPPLVAFFISMFTSTGGVSGAFLLLPFQMSVLNFTSPAVSSTNQLYNVIAIPSGVWRYIKEGRMVWPLTWIVIAGTVPGVFIGAILRLNYLPDPTAFKIFAGFMLLYLGIRLIMDILKKKPKNANDNKFRDLVRQNAESGSANNKLPKTRVIKFGLRKLTYEFYDEIYEVSTFKIFIVSSIVGIAGGAYGIGGGAIMAPIYVAFFGLPVYTVAGAALMGTFITSVIGVVFYQFLAQFYPHLSVSPDWMLGFLFGIGGFAGMYVGARLQKHIPANIIKWILAACIMFISFNYISLIFR